MSEECIEEDDTVNSGEISADNASVEEEYTVEDADDKNHGADSEKNDSAIQVCVTYMFALLNEWVI